jgi:hypothetical protein
MNGGHWTERDFIDHLYGIGPQDGHLAVCAGCEALWAEIRVRHQSVVQEPEIPREILAEQRRNIYRKLGREPRPTAARMAAPAFAAVLLLLLGIFFMRPTPQSTVPSATSVSDAQLFSDIYALEQTSEPHVAKPMRALFEEN